jgi:hypothetical protein
MQSSQEKVQASLHPKELELLKALRERFQYGEVVILMRGGLPYRISRAVEFETFDRKGDGVL